MGQDRISKAGKIVLASCLLAGCSALFATGEWDHAAINARYDAALKTCGAQQKADAFNSAEKNYYLCVNRIEENRALEHYRADRPWARDQGGGAGVGISNVYIINSNGRRFDCETNLQT
jgi:hypothetical protein